MATYWKAFDRSGLHIGTLATDSLTDAVDWPYTRHLALM
jgi:hypothetical protein